MARYASNRFIDEVRKGRIPNHQNIQISGSNGEVGTSKETLWPEGGAYSFPTSGSQMTVSSASTNDAAAGTGATLVRLEALDSNFNTIVEFIATDGQSGVTTTSEDIYRINRLDVIGAGSGETNDGIIYVGTGTITNGKPANVYSHTPAGAAFHNGAVYTIPKDHVGLVLGITTMSQSNKAIQTDFKIRNGAIGVVGVAQRVYQPADLSRVVFEAGGLLPSGTDIFLDCAVDSSTAVVTTIVDMYITREDTAQGA